MTMPMPEAHRTMEQWEITTAGRVWLTTTSHNRFGQPIEKDISVGPNRVGARIKISQADRELNQERIADAAMDPFRNGLLVRADKSQQEDPATASSDAIATKDLLAIFAKHGNAFHAAVDSLGELPLRRLLELCDEVDASAKQKEYLAEQVETRFTNRRSQEDAVYDLSGYRDRDRERAVVAQDES